MHDNARTYHVISLKRGTIHLKSHSRKRMGHGLTQICTDHWLGYIEPMGVPIGENYFDLCVSVAS